MSVTTRHQGDILNQKETPYVINPIWWNYHGKTKVDESSLKAPPFGKKFKNLYFLMILNGEAF